MTANPPVPIGSWCSPLRIPASALLASRKATGPRSAVLLLDVVTRVAEGAVVVNVPSTSRMPRIGLCHGLSSLFGAAFPLPSSLSSPTRTLAALRGRHLRRSRGSTEQTTLVPTRNRRRVLLSDRLRLALTSRQVHDGLGSLVRVAGHLGPLHGPASIAARSHACQPGGNSN
jgi:hypothetical protein